MTRVMATNIATMTDDDPGNENKRLSWLGKFEEIQKSSSEQSKMNKSHLKENFCIF